MPYGVMDNLIVLPDCHRLISSSWTGHAQVLMHSIIEENGACTFEQLDTCRGRFERDGNPGVGVLQYFHDARSQKSLNEFVP